MLNHDKYIKRRNELTKRCVNDPTYEKIANEAIDELVLAVIGENGVARRLEKCGFTNHRNEVLYKQRLIVKGDE